MHIDENIKQMRRDKVSQQKKTKSSLSFVTM